MNLYEKYRPATWSEVVGQDKVIETIIQLRKRGLGGRAYFISGQSGTGKTTIARLIAAEIADEWYIEELDATSVTPAALVKIESSLQYVSLKLFSSQTDEAVVGEIASISATTPPIKPTKKIKHADTTNPFITIYKNNIYKFT